MSNDIYYIPYTYLIKFKPTGQVYYGVRYAKGCVPDDLWKTYFTSSKVVKSLIEEYGIDAFDYEVRKTFENGDSARAWEKRVLKTLNVVNDDRWLNKNDTISIAPMPGENNPMYGKTHSEETKKRMSCDRKGKRSGENNPMYGKTHSEETKKKMQGQKRSHETKRKISQYAKNRTDEHKENLKKSLQGKFLGPRNSMYGKTHSEEAKKKISDAKKGKFGEKNSFYGKHHSEETRKHLSDVAKQRKRLPCQYCSREITRNNLKKHETACKNYFTLSLT